MGTLPTDQRYSPSSLNVDAPSSTFTFRPATERSLGDSALAKLRVPLKSIIDGPDGNNGPIQGPRYVAGRDGLLTQIPFKISNARIGPDKGGYDPVTFFESLHYTHYPAGAPGYVYLPLKTLETWTIVEPFACNWPERIAASQARSAFARQQWSPRENC